MLIYLDTGCFNRPFDDQSQTRIRFETEAKLELQQQVRQNKVGLVWSYVLDFENKPTQGEPVDTVFPVKRK